MSVVVVVSHLQSDELLDKAESVFYKHEVVSENADLHGFTILTVKHTFHTDTRIVLTPPIPRLASTQHQSDMLSHRIVVAVALARAENYLALVLVSGFTPDLFSLGLAARKAGLGDRTFETFPMDYGSADAEIAVKHNHSLYDNLVEKLKTLQAPISPPEPQLAQVWFAADVFGVGGSDFVQRCGTLGLRVVFCALPRDDPQGRLKTYLDQFNSPEIQSSGVVGFCAYLSPQLAEKVQAGATFNIIRAGKRQKNSDVVLEWNDNPGELAALVAKQVALAQLQAICQRAHLTRKDVEAASVDLALALGRPCRSYGGGDVNTELAAFWMSGKLYTQQALAAFRGNEWLLVRALAVERVCAWGPNAQVANLKSEGDDHTISAFLSQLVGALAGAIHEQDLESFAKHISLLNGLDDQDVAYLIYLEKQKAAIEVAMTAHCLAFLRVPTGKQPNTSRRATLGMPGTVEMLDRLAALGNSE